MKKTIVIFSDSHGSSFNMSEVMKKYPDAECVIHLGDGAHDTSYLSLPPPTGLLTVRGNCDFMTDQPPFIRVNMLGLDFYICHGDAFGVKYGVKRYEDFAVSNVIDVALFGHTHTPYLNSIETEKKTVHVFNPGSISRPWTGKPSYGLVIVEDGKINILHKSV
jgi:putative phosphoesterase